MGSRAICGTSIEALADNLDETIKSFKKTALLGSMRTNSEGYITDP